jgi:hypothetical protein
MALITPELSFSTVPIQSLTRIIDKRILLRRAPEGGFGDQGRFGAKANLRDKVFRVCLTKATYIMETSVEGKTPTEQF